MPWAQMSSTTLGNIHCVVGGVALYVVGILYMFVGIGIVCDDFFVASLEAISEALNLSEDVAGYRPLNSPVANTSAHHKTVL